LLDEGLRCVQLLLLEDHGFVVVVVAVVVKLEPLQFLLLLEHVGVLLEITVALVISVPITSSFLAAAKFAHTLPAKVVMASCARHVIAPTVLFNGHAALWARASNSGNKLLVHAFVTSACFLPPFCHHAA